jgi:hypothetical protein
LKAIMARSSTVVLRIVLGFLLLCMTLAGIVIGWISYFGDPVERAFMAHKTNQQIVERNPRWNQALNGLDVSDLFERNLKRGDYERNLGAMGY